MHAWMNGELIPWDEARVHVRTDAFMRGASVFEGIRGYAHADGRQLYLFKLADHMDRLYNVSMKILRMQLKWTADELSAGIIALLKADDVRRDVHIRPQVYYGSGEDHGFDPAKIEVGCVITALERPPKALDAGIDVCVSSWRRIDDEAMPPRVKAAANYLNGRYVVTQAKVDGYDSAIVLNRHGKVTEGPGACLMMVRDGKVVRPPETSGVLESITSRTLVDLFHTELGIEVIDRDIDRTELYVADELFFCGTGFEILPIFSVDRYPVGNGARGSVTAAIQDAYFQIARGKNEAYRHLLTTVY